ncbi:hypothetical protein CaCOL14_003574 [Colletotrichum acutatum]
MTSVPAVCFAECNNAYIEAQGVGKDPSLCNIASPFAKDLIDCQVCIGVNSKNSTSFEDLGPEFQQYLDLCNPIQTVTYAVTFTRLNGDIDYLNYFFVFFVANHTTDRNSFGRIVLEPQ